MSKAIDFSTFSNDELERMDQRLHEYRMNNRSEWGRVSILIEKISTERLAREHAQTALQKLKRAAATVAYRA